VELVFANAKLYNPVGHPVHTMAVEAQDAFFRELNALASSWGSSGAEEVRDEGDAWLRHATLSMSLDTRLVGVAKPACASEPSSSVGDESLPAKPTSSETYAETNDSSLSIQAVVSADEASMPVPETAETLSDLVDAAVGAASLSSLVAPVPDAATSKATESPLVKRRGRKPKPPPKKLDLLTDGPDAVHHCMVGEDVWLLENRDPLPPKNSSGGKKKNGKRKKTAREVQEEPPSKRRRQSWLGEEVGVSMRKIRTAFFTCSLMPKAEMSEVEHAKLEHFDKYIAPFSSLSQDLPDTHVGPSRVADARHGLLEFSQYRNFEFDTLRRAKYSTSMLLYHLYFDDAPGLAPSCTSCSKTIHRVRWHEIRKRSIRNSNMTAEELCSECHSTRPDGDKFLPLPVTFRSSHD
jgi:hypothetical protein